MIDTKAEKRQTFTSLVVVFASATLRKVEDTISGELSYLMSAKQIMWLTDFRFEGMPTVLSAGHRCQDNVL